MLDISIHKGVEIVRVGLLSGRINTTVNVFRIGSTVIDVGPPNQWQKVHSFLAKRRDKISQVLITHHHEDHSGNGAHIINTFPHISVRVPDVTAPFIQMGYPVQIYRGLIWGWPKRYRPTGIFFTGVKHKTSCSPQTILTSAQSELGKTVKMSPLLKNEARNDFGDPIPIVQQSDLQIDSDFKFVPLAAPGHSSDHTVFLEENNGWLFSGDLFITTKPLTSRNDEDVKSEIETLKRVLSYDFDTLFCAHRGVVPNGKAALALRLEHLLEIQNKATMLCKKGLTTADIAQKLLGKEEILYYMSFGHFSKAHLVAGLLDERLQQMKQ